METLVNYSASEGVATIELSNPPANAYSVRDDAAARRGDPRGALRRPRAT